MLNCQSARAKHQLFLSCFISHPSPIGPAVLWKVIHMVWTWIPQISSLMQGYHFWWLFLYCWACIFLVAFCLSFYVKLGIMEKSLGEKHFIKKRHVQKYVKDTFDRNLYHQSFYSIIWYQEKKNILANDKSLTVGPSVLCFKVSLQSQLEIKHVLIHTVARLLIHPFSDLYWKLFCFCWVYLGWKNGYTFSLCVSQLHAT